MKKEVTTLDKVSGAWTESRQHSKFMRVAVKAEFDMSTVTPAVKKKVITGVRTGVLDSTGGMAAIVYRVLCDGFNLKYVCASHTGGGLYSNFSDKEFYDALVATFALTNPKMNTGSGRYVSQYRQGIRCWSWRAQAGVTRNLFEETVGFEDKETREEAINFLTEGGVLTQTWIDKRPR